MKRFALLVLTILFVFAACSSGGTGTQSINIPYPKADVVTLNVNNFAGQVAINAADRDIHSAPRVAGDAEKVSVHVQTIGDLLREADYFAGTKSRAVVAAEDVQAAIDAQIMRASRLRERINEEIRRGTILIDTKGAVVGQVNGLSVLQLGRYAFGRPSRITARLRISSCSRN